MSSLSTQKLFKNVCASTFLGNFFFPKSAITLGTYHPYQGLGLSSLFVKAAAADDDSFETSDPFPFDLMSLF